MFIDAYTLNIDTLYIICGCEIIDGKNIYTKVCLINWRARKAVTPCCGSHSFSGLNIFINPEP